ncbi:MAG: hypothetical protein IT562_21080 [Alphaproteobacteria bacterium]|nr:hypothetical protein [Alphaproteobacteria bacterium]
MPHPALERQQSRRGAAPLPGPKVATDDALRNNARETGATIYHPVGTCKMGDDPLAVVDARLRVHGVAGLRVVDGSVMPTLTSGNTNAPRVRPRRRYSRRRGWRPTERPRGGDRRWCRPRPC